MVEVTLAGKLPFAPCKEMESDGPGKIGRRRGLHGIGRGVRSQRREPRRGRTRGEDAARASHECTLLVGASLRERLAVLGCFRRPSTRALRCGLPRTLRAAPGPVCQWP